MSSYSRASEIAVGIQGTGSSPGFAGAQSPVSPSLHARTAVANA